MKWLKRVVIAVVLIIVVLSALPFFITLNDYIPQVEKLASDKLLQPVTIAGIKFSALPYPHVTVEGIVVGKSDDINIGKVNIFLDLFSLLGPTKVIRNLDIDSLALSDRALTLIPALSKSESTGPAPFRVENIRLDNATAHLGDFKIGPFDAHVRLNVQGEPQEMSVALRDGKAKVLITPDAQSKYLIDAQLKAWTAPAGAAILFDELLIKGVASLKDADLTQISAKLYGGTATGSARLAWQEGLQIKGQLDVRQVELKPIVALLTSGANISGRLDAKPAFSAAADSADQLLKSLRLETPFQIHHGVLHGVDIQQAATSLLKQGTKGGQTAFDQLSGHLMMERGAYRFTQLKIASGVLGAEGQVSISARKELSGRINAQVSALGASATVPLNVAGTLDLPLLYPSGATITGAAVGTAILGPGIGTSVGAKVGEWAEGLLGGARDKKTK